MLHYNILYIHVYIHICLYICIFIYTYISRSEGESDCDESPYELILQRSSLARGLKSVFSNLSTSGIVNIMINKWIQVRFCLPQKVHQSHKKGLLIDPEIIDRFVTL